MTNAITSSGAQKLVVRCFILSVDGLGAGVNQRLDQPFGDNEPR